MHWGTATKARGQNTEHDRIAPRQRCYLDDRVHDEQRQRAPLLCHRHRCRCHRRDIPGIWRLVWTRANQLTPLSRAHAKTEKKIGQQQIAVAATAALALARSYFEQIIKAVAVASRYSHSLYCAIIIEESEVHKRGGGRDCQPTAPDDSLRQRPISLARLPARRSRIITLRVVKRHKS